MGKLYLAGIAAMFIATPTASAPSPTSPLASLSANPAERGKTCFYAGTNHGRAVGGLEGFWILQYFIYVGAGAYHGPAVTLEELGQINSRLGDGEAIAKATPLTKACLDAFPLSTGGAEVVLPRERIDSFATCEAISRTIPAALRALIEQPQISEQEQLKIANAGIKASQLRANLTSVAPAMAASSGLDWPGLSRKMDDAVGAFPVLGRPDAVVEACLKAFPSSASPLPRS